MTSVAIAVPVAIAASVTFGWSTAAMHNSAFHAPDQASGLRKLILHVIKQPRWLSGMAASLTGLVLHALALSIGSIVVVQPIIATGLIWSFGFGELLQRRRPPATMIRWAVLMAIGLAVFFSFDVSTHGHDQPYAKQSALMLTIGTGVIAVCWLASQGGTRRRSGILLGAAAGVVFGLVAGTLKATAASATFGIGNLFTSWPVYVLLGLGVAGFILNQAAYNRVPLSQSLPILNVVNPMTALVFGYVAFDERPSGSSGSVIAESLGLALTLASVFMLARTEVTELSHD